MSASLSNHSSHNDKTDYKSVSEYWKSKDSQKVDKTVPSVESRIQQLGTQELKSDVFSLDNRNWDLANSMTTSIAGVFGVWYVTGPKEEIVLKPFHLAQGEVFSTRLMKAFGLQSPEARFVSKKSEEKAKIIACSRRIQDTGQLFNKAQYRDRQPLHEHERIEGDEYIIMERVQGYNLGELNSPENSSVEEFIEICETPKFSQEIGRMFVCDRILNNDDRLGSFVSSKINSGNMMVDKNGLVVIDQNVSTIRDQEKRKVYHSQLKEELIDKLFDSDPDVSLKLARNIANLIKVHCRLNLQPEHVLKGMRSAVIDFARKPEHYISEANQIADEIKKQANLTGAYEELMRRKYLPEEQTCVEFIEQNIQVIAEAYKKMATT